MLSKCLNPPLPDALSLPLLHFTTQQQHHTHNLGTQEQTLTTMTLHQNLSKLSLAPSYRTVDPISASSTNLHRVGKLDDVHFTTPTSLHRHLKLLGAFRLLRTKVEASQAHGISDSRAKWTVFAHLATHRYERYVQYIVAGGSGTVSLPPLDVAMVFHTHLLNPTYVPAPLALTICDKVCSYRIDVFCRRRIFAEDKLRTFPELELLSDRLLTQFVSFSPISPSVALIQAKRVSL